MNRIILSTCYQLIRTFKGLFSCLQTNQTMLQRTKLFKTYILVSAATFEISKLFSLFSTKDKDTVYIFVFIVFLGYYQQLGEIRGNVEIVGTYGGKKIRVAIKAR